MRLEANLNMRQEMRMRLAPQIIQSIEILQLPLIELRQRIDDELLENVLLEQSDTAEQDQGEQGEQAEGEGGESAEPAVEREVESSDSPEPVDAPTEAEQFERVEDMNRYYEDFSGGARRSPNVESSKQEAFENSPAPEITLAEHLSHQLAYLELSERVEETAENIIANLDDHGLLQGTLEEIVAAVDGEISQEEAERALDVVQHLEPLGVGARDQKECLVLQLDQRRPGYEFLRRLITEHFEDILHNKYPQVVKAMGCTMEELKDGVEAIGRLNPNPGSLFSGQSVPHVLPDVRIERHDGEYVVILNETWLPSLRISAYYARRLRDPDLDPKTREYMKKKFQSAQGLIDAIEQRRATLQNVTEEIVKAQREFFDRGKMHLKPLKMQEIADEVGVHVSTVSRAISDKYAQTPRGIYALKYFFTGGLSTSDGDEESWEVVRHMLTAIVNGEDKSDPLSDEAIADALREKGIDIARRTVSKYRKTLNIASSRQRKEY